jgi:hypothetical protein
VLGDLGLWKSPDRSNVEANLEEITERLAANPTADDYVAGFVCGLRVLIAEIRDDETSRGVICPS